LESSSATSSEQQLAGGPHPSPHTVWEARDHPVEGLAGG
jgi:hypothetical protein